MSDSDHFESPKLLLGHAGEHIDRLKNEIKAFFDRQPYTRVIDHDPETRAEVHKVRLTAKLPSKIRLILKDATTNLRDALDHAVYASAVSLGMVNPEKTGFPFATDANHLESELGTWKFKHVPKEIHPTLMGFKPYPAGNDLLVGLNRIRNPNTHRVVVPAGFATMGNEMTMAQGTLTSGSQLGYSRWDATKNEVEYARLGFGSKFDYKVKVAFDVSFGDVGPMAGKPVIPTLREIAAEVERVVFGIEAQTARILRERNL